MLLLAAFAAGQTFEITVPEPVLEHRGNILELSVPGMAHRETEGGMLLPARHFFVPVPQGSEPVLEWTVESVAETGWNPGLLFSSAPVLTGTGFSTRETREAVAFPSEHSPVSMEIVHILGSTAARVTLSPFCYGTPEMYASRVSITLSHSQTSGGRPTAGTLFEALSPGSETWWPYRTESPESPFWGKPWARIRVETPGFYAVTAQELADAGCDVSGVPSASLAMFSGPAKMFDPEDPAAEHYLEAAAITVHDGGDGVFHMEDSLVFYGRGLWNWNSTPDSLYRSPHRYDDGNTYWLTWGADNGERITAVNAEPSGGAPVEQGILTIGFEEEVFFNSEDNRTGWLWGILSANVPGYFYLSSPVASDAASLRLGILKAGSHPWEHNLIAELDGEVVLDTLSNGVRHERFSINGVSVASGGNLLKLWSDYHKTCYLDYAELLVPVNLSQSAGYHVYLNGLSQGKISFDLGTVTPETRIYDIDSPLAPVELTGWTAQEGNASLSYTPGSQTACILAVSPANLKKVVSIEPAQPGRILGSVSPADVLVAIPEELSDGAGLIQSLYSSRGLSTCIVTYREIYDEFSQGVSDPGAVRSLVRWALDTWPSPPEMLLLVGDGSSDPLGISTGYRTPAPIYYELVSGYCLESFFTTVHEGMEFPEIPYCRIPASTVNELLTALQKAFELDGPGALGPWGNSIVMAADDEWGTALKTESVHTQTCDFLADSILNQSLNIIKHYLIEYPWPPGTTGEGVHPEKPQAAQDLIALFNQGVSSFSFYGHGSYDQMASEKLFSSGMVTQLTNGPRYFLYNSFSCNNGEFNLPAGDCLAEILLFHPDGGAGVAMACTGGSYSGQNKSLGASFLGRVYSGEGEITVAEAFWLSVVELQYPKNLEYAVLGDGGIVIPMADEDLCVIQPPDTMFRGRLSSAGFSFPSETTFLFRARESADSVTYASPLTEDFSFEYLRYGSTIYSGMNATDGQGNALVEFFVPLQADTGSMGRTDGTGTVAGLSGIGYAWPVPVADDGNYTDDTAGPEIELSFLDAIPGEIPSVYQNSVLRAVLSDPSGICVLGSDAGSIIICSIDGEYEDVTSLFSFNRGSYTTGSLEYTLPELLPGQHEVKVVARDGMKNTGEGILSFNVLEGEPPLLHETGVYPNPSRGTRAFFFTTSSAGTVNVSLYTIAGRPVWEGSTAVSSGADQLLWNGLDADGDPPAAGTYIYVLGFTGVSGSASVTDLLVVSP